MRNRNHETARAAGAALLLLWIGALSGCGGSGSFSVAGGGTGGTGLTAGPITGFGSVFVNRVEFTTDNTARFLLDDDPANPAVGDDNSVFREGMYVRVFHDAGDNAATRIEFQHDVEGTVTGRTATGFAVLGLPVSVDNGTRFYDSEVPLPSYDEIQDGLFVSVSGIPDGDGGIRATFVERSGGSGNDPRIKGYVDGLDPGTKTFRIGSSPDRGVVEVEYSAVPEDRLPGAGLQNGFYVEVRVEGNVTDSEIPPLAPERIEAKGDVADLAGGVDRTSVEGVAAGVTEDPPGTKTFRLGGLTVRGTESARFEDGAFSDLVDGSLIEAEGPVRGGVLEAEKIEFR